MHMSSSKVVPLTTAWLDTSLLSTISKGMDKIIWNLDLKYFTNADAIYRLIGLIIWNFKRIWNPEKAFSHKHSSCLQVDFFTLDQASLLFDDWKVNGRYVLKCQIEILPNLINSVLFVGISSTVRNSNMYKWIQMSLQPFVQLSFWIPCWICPRHHLDGHVTARGGHVTFERWSRDQGPGHVT